MNDHLLSNNLSSNYSTIISNSISVEIDFKKKPTNLIYILDPLTSNPDFDECLCF